MAEENGNTSRAAAGDNNDAAVDRMSSSSADALSNDGLPKTCTIIEKNDEREVYVVGTAHFSKESQEDVALVSE